VCLSGIDFDHLRSLSDPRVTDLPAALTLPTPARRTSYIDFIVFLCGVLLEGSLLLTCLIYRSSQQSRLINHGCGRQGRAGEHLYHWAPSNCGVAAL
jgi:hypothetical protein